MVNMNISASANCCLWFTEAFFGHGLLRCLFTSKDDVVYLGQLYFNKVLLGQYNSTLGKYVGFTEKTQGIADELNKNKGFLEGEKKNEQKCRDNTPLAFDVLSRPGEHSCNSNSVLNHSSLLITLSSCILGSDPGSQAEGCLGKWEKPKLKVKKKKKTGPKSKSNYQNKRIGKFHAPSFVGIIWG